MPTLADVVANKTNAAPATPALATRPLSGKERHPLILLSGGYKVGKSWAIAAASADPRVARLRVTQMGSSVFHVDSTTYAAAVAAKIRTAIEEKGISVLSVATSTGIPRTTLDRRFKSDGAAPFTVREIKKIANILGISASELTTVYEIAEKVPA